MSISIIIPTLNEADYLAETISTARKNAVQASHEIIVSDCGSIDTTIDVARKLKVKHTVHPAANHRAAAIRAGMKQASGDILLFLDADTLLPPHYDTSVYQILNEKKVVGGAFPLTFRESKPLLRFIALLNNARYRLTKRYFGDQAVFVERAVYEQVGGFPDQSLLASVHFCDRLKRAGKLRLANMTSVRTSGRRFFENGVIRTFFRDSWILVNDYFGFPISRYGSSYWDDNRRRGWQKRGQV